MKKNFIRCFVLVVFALFLISTPVITHAQGQTEFTGNVVTLKEKVEAYREMDTNSELVHTFNAGEDVFLTGEKNGWYQIFYQGGPLYFQTGKTKNELVVQSDEASDATSEISEEFTNAQQAYEELISSETVLDEKNSEDAKEQAKELDEEFESHQKSDETFVDRYVQEERSRKNARMWIVIISALVVAIIAVSVVGAVKNNKKEKSEE